MSFAWPEGKRAAVSLSFDDARLSQIDTGLTVLKKKGVKVTFFVQPGGVEQRLAGWKQAVADGHEIANHTRTHPCTGNYEFSQNNALENYDLAKIAQEIDGASQEIYQELGVKPRTFAYPCGQKFVGRGADVKSYVALVAQRFVAGRGYLDESPNDPVICDLAQTMGTVFDDMDFAAMKKIIDDAVEQGRWVIFVGHEIGPRAFQTTDTKALEALCDYLKDAHNGVWVGTVAEVAMYIQEQRGNRTAQK
ncbi:MAG TPA: polysaccharide deacetylase family protein [Verrucomicrobiae bacterium]|nr:polysaccharide deacetylase family protein [Verrucomicrobiae bacterium]